MLQFLVRHPAILDFTIRYIECRSTTCQIGLAMVRVWASWSSFGDVEGQYLTIAQLQRLLAERD